MVVGLYVKIVKQKLIKWFPSLWSEKSESYKDTKLKASTFLPFLISSVGKHSPFELEKKIGSNQASLGSFSVIYVI